MSLFDQEYREIITKAVCGKGRKFTKETHKIKPSHRPTSILGCWVINHVFDAKLKGNYVEVNGTYEIHTWYSYNDSTKTDVFIEKVPYCDKVKLSVRDKNTLKDDLEVVVDVMQQPNCLTCEIDDGGKILAEVEREFVVKVVGETKVVVKVNPDGLDSSDDFDWSSDLSSEEFESINPSFLEDDH